MTKKNLGMIAALVLIMIAVVAAVRSNGDDPIAFTCSVGSDLEVYVSNNSDQTLVINHITIIAAGQVYTTPKDTRITNAALFLHVPIEWRAGEDAVVMVGCTYGRTSYVEQLTRY